MYEVEVADRQPRPFWPSVQGWSVA